MRNFYFIAATAMFISKTHCQQNLVQNHSFEEFDNCPSSFGGNNLSNGWFPFTSSPDYFNSCSSNPTVDVPDNSFGSQLAATGNAYCGFMCYIQTNTNELLGSKLSNVLTVGIKYFINLKISLAGSSPCGINKLGMLFSTISYCDSLNAFNVCYSPPAPLTNYAHVYSSQIVIDTTNWVSIAGSYIADSAYQYIILGNLFDYANTNYSLLYGNTSCGNSLVYYYIDDVCVSTDSLFCANFSAVDENIIDNDIFLYPNPFNDRATLQINANTENVPIVIKIFTVFGETVRTIKTNSQRAVEIYKENLSEGIYFYTILINDKHFTKKLIITN